jgi:hypothetical protein
VNPTLTQCGASSRHLRLTPSTLYRHLLCVAMIVLPEWWPSTSVDPVVALRTD